VIGFAINDVTEIYIRVPYCSVIAFMCVPVPDVYRRPMCRLVYSEVKLTLFTKYSIPLKIAKLLWGRKSYIKKLWGQIRPEHKLYTHRYR